MTIGTVKSGKKAEKTIVIQFSGVSHGSQVANRAIYKLSTGRKVKKTIKYDRAIKIKSAT